MKFLPGNAQHIGARSSQQDSFGFADPDDAAFIAHAGFLAIVCDGMGGMEHGDAASKAAVRAFLDAYQLKTPEETIPAALERSTRFANDQVVELARRYGKVESIGTTLVATAVLERSMYFISVGDSGLFHVAGGQVWTVNRPHIYANLLDQAVARGDITREDALAHPERESLTSFIGAEILQEIDRNTEPWPLGEGDTLLLASDGMFKTLSHEEIVASLHGAPVSWPESLVGQVMAKHREFQDNVTVLSVTVESEDRQAEPRTVLMAPPQRAEAGGRGAIPTTIQLPMDPAPVELPPPLLEAPIAPPLLLAPPALAMAPVAAPPVGASSVAGSRGARGGLWLAVGGLVLACAAGGGWWFWTHRASNVPEPLAAPNAGTPRVQETPSKPIPQEEPLPEGVERKVQPPPEEKPAAPKRVNLKRLIQGNGKKDAPKQVAKPVGEVAPKQEELKEEPPAAEKDAGGKN